MTLDQFSPPVREWFSTSFPEPTPPQTMGWPAIAKGDNTLILAPTGSGKTLSAFLWGIDRLTSEPTPADDPHTRIITDQAGGGLNLESSSYICKS